MKKLLPLVVVGILVLGGLGAVAITDDTTYDVKTKEGSVVISEPIIKEAGQYVTVSLGEATSSLLQAGKPVLPVVTRVFTLPFGSKISRVDVSFSEVNELVLSKEVQPAPEPVPLNAGLQVPKEPVKDTKVYGSAELYPASGYSYITGAGLDGEKPVIYLAVKCYLVRYSPAQNMIYYSESADIKVIYEERTDPIPMIFDDVYDMVIISPSEFSEELQPLIDHKDSHEVDTLLKTTEEIYDEYEGWDEAEEIKYFIRDAIENWGIDYVLLIGSVDKLPIRTTWFFQRWHQHYWNTTVLSDLYYGDIYDENGDFCSWDSNNNGMYGEIYQNCPGVNDTVDLYPDVNVGRLACEKKKDVSTVVDKIIHYETSAYGESWFSNIVLCGGDTFPGWDGNEGEEKNKITEQIMSDFVPTRLWTSDNTFSARALNKAVNRGAGFVDYSGHGFEMGIGTHPPDDESWIMYYTPRLIGALNGYKLPIVYFDACLTAKLDFNMSELIGSISVPASSSSPESLLTTWDYKPLTRTLQPLVASSEKLPLSDKLVPCFAWSWVKKSNGGAIATIGATRTAYGDLTMGCGYLSLQFYEAYSSSETVSQMLTKAQNEYINNLWKDYFTLEEFILLGDPSLKIGGYEEDSGSSSSPSSQSSQQNSQSNGQQSSTMLNSYTSQALQVVKTTHR